MNTIDIAVELGIPISSGSANIEMRLAQGYIQWRLPNAATWTNLLALSELQDAAAGVMISSAQLNSNGELVFTLSDGRELNAGALDGLSAEQEAQLETAYEHSQDALTNMEIEALINNFTE